MPAKSGLFYAPTRAARERLAGRTTKPGNEGATSARGVTVGRGGVAVGESLSPCR